MDPPVSRRKSQRSRRCLSPRDEPPRSPYLEPMTLSAAAPPILETGILDQAGVDPADALSLLKTALNGADDG